MDYKTWGMYLAAAVVGIVIYKKVPAVKAAVDKLPLIN